MTKFTDEVTDYSRNDPQIAQFVTEIQKFTAATNKVYTYLTYYYQTFSKFEYLIY